MNENFTKKLKVGNLVKFSSHELMKPTSIGLIIDKEIMSFGIEDAVYYQILTNDNQIVSVYYSLVMEKIT